MAAKRTVRLVERSRSCRVRLVGQRALVALACLLLVTANTPAQIIKGTVRDAESKDIVRDAFVALVDTTATMHYGVHADARGRFKLSVQPGIFTIVTSKDGYIRQLSDWISVAPADTYEVNVKLARPVTTLSPVLIAAERDSIRNASLLGLSARAMSGTIVTPTEVRRAALTASSAYDVVETLHIPSLYLRTIRIDEDRPNLPSGYYRCIAFRRTSNCVTVVVNGQRYSNVGDLLQLEGLLGPQDISHMIFLRPNEAGTLYGEETTNGVLVIVRKGENR